VKSIDYDVGNGCAKQIAGCRPSGTPRSDQQGDQVVGPVMVPVVGEYL
jgi:hypothetical protein